MIGSLAFSLPSLLLLPPPHTLVHAGHGCTQVSSQQGGAGRLKRAPDLVSRLAQLDLVGADSSRLARGLEEGLERAAGRPGQEGPRRVRRHARERRLARQGQDGAPSSLRSPPPRPPSSLSSRPTPRSAPLTPVPCSAPQLLRLPPPTNPYVLRITIDAGTAASRNGVLQTNFPLDGGNFKRDRFSSVRCVQCCPPSLAASLTADELALLLQASSRL